MWLTNFRIINCFLISIKWGQSVRAMDGSEVWEGNKAQAAALEPDVYNTESIVEQASDIFLHIFVFPIDAT